MYQQPENLTQALRLLADGPWSIVAGGTDFYPGLGDRQPDGPVLDISAIAGLRSIEEEQDHWRIGALVSWTDLIDAPLPPAFDALKLAAREVGSVQIQNRATVAGNLCNASPAADGVPPLLILDATIELQSQDGRRLLDLANFIEGNRKTALRGDEIVTAILIPKRSTAGGSNFLKLGARKYLVISIAMVAARMDIAADGKVADVAIAVGSCSEVAQRLRTLEAALMGQHMDDSLPGRITSEHLGGLAPIDDVRATKAYRLEAARELVSRVVAGRLSNAGAA